MRVLTPEELIAHKVISVTSRAAQPKGDTDRRDLKLLLLNYPHLKIESGAVKKCLAVAGAKFAAMEEWTRLVGSTIESGTDDGEF